ncbi:MAG: FMN reductase [Actinomycetales bacterium]|nr:FMN reductase [Actinomycetales bacterium]
MSGQGYRIAVVTAGLREPSSTRMLADRLAEAAALAMSERGAQVELDVVDVRLYAGAMTNALLTGVEATELTAALRRVTSADAVIAVTPIFSGSYNGLFKMFFDLLGEDALTGTPVLLGATAGTPRHSLAVDHALRPLFAYLRALVVPTAVFAATDDFGQVGSGKRSDDVAPLAQRVTRAGGELADLVVARGRKTVKDEFSDYTDFTSLLANP